MFFKGLSEANLEDRVKEVKEEHHHFMRCSISLRCDMWFDISIRYILLCKTEELETNWTSCYIKQVAM